VPSALLWCKQCVWRELSRFVTCRGKCSLQGRENALHQLGARVLTPLPSLETVTSWCELLACRPTISTAQLSCPSHKVIRRRSC
jgi:hypothetical protein